MEKTTAELQQQLAEIHHKNTSNGDHNLQIEQEDVTFTNDVFIPPSNTVIGCYQNQNEMYAQTESSSKKLIYDTRDLFRYQQE